MRLYLRTVLRYACTYVPRYIRARLYLRLTYIYVLYGLVVCTQAIGLVENQSDWYLGKLWRNHKPWPALVGTTLIASLIHMNLSHESL